MSNVFVLPKQVPLTSAGRVYPGAKAYFYRTNTQTPKAVYSDAAHGSPITQPVTADAGGTFQTVFLDTSDFEYRVTLTTAADVLIYTQDDVGGRLDQDDFDAFLSDVTAEQIGQIIFPRTAAEIAAGVTPTLYSKQPGDLLRYGFSTLASASVNSAAFNNACLSNSLVFCDLAGTYVCSDVLLVQSNNTIRLAQGVVLQPSVKLWGSPFVRIDGKTGVRWLGGKLNGNKAANPTGTIIGLAVLDSSDVKIIGVTSNNFPSDNVSNGAQGDGFYAGGVVNPGATQVDFIGCTADGNVRQGLSIVRAKGVSVIGGFYGNTSGNNPGGGIDCEADNNTYTLSEISLIGVHVSGCYYGIIFQQFCVNSSMVGCTITDCRFAHIYFGGCSRISVTGCTIDAQVAFDASSPIIEAVGADNVVFTGNYVRGANLTNQGAGFRVLQGNTNFLIAENIFKETKTQGAGVGSSAISITNTLIRIRGNTFVDCVAAGAVGTAVIAVAGNTGSAIYPLLVFILDNIIYDTRSGGNEADTAIDVSTGIPAATQQNYRVDRNVSNGPAAVYTAGAFQPMTGGVTWNPGDLADGVGETSPDITVLGAAFGDRVEVYTPYAIADCICTGSVKSSDTCVIRLQNESGGANFNGASATWKVRVRKLNEG